MLCLIYQDQEGINMSSILNLSGGSYDSSLYESLYNSLYGTGNNNTGSVYDDLCSSIYDTEESSTASNLDTEALVESSVSGLRQKIESLENKRTQVEWKQEAYQNLIDLMSGFDSKYTADTAASSLLSDSFWRNTDGEPEEGDAVGSGETADADRVVDTVKAMVEDYNALVSEVKAAYSTMPADEEEIAANSELVKQGILFAANDVRSLSEKLRGAVTSNAAALSAIGLNVEYSDGLTTLTLDEDALRSALEDTPDVVRNTLATEGGVMDTVKDTLDTYGDTGNGQGVLVELAGSESSYGRQSVLHKELEQYNEQIVALQNTLASKIDYYTSQYTMLDLFITQMNSQSASLLDLLNI